MLHPTEPAAPGPLTETQARDVLLALCWPDGQKFCPRCNTPSPYQLAGGRLRCGGCRYTFHDFTGRWLNETGLSPLKWMALAQAFTRELNTRETAARIGISYNTAFKALTALRLAILAQGADAPQMLAPGAPLSVFLDGGEPEEQAQVSGTGLPVYGILNRSQRLFVDLLPELTAESVLHFNHNFHLRVARHGSILITDRYKTYDALILCGDETLPYHYLLRHPGLIFAESGGSPFWDFAKPRLKQFKGLSWRRFPLYLKELALRFNLRGHDLTPTLLGALCAPVPKLA
ncbi:MAG: IS1595 family transposase [Humidesulfovibrio sp.]|nr:IS1595 family transposase [Humidesulfovibrio sp.]